MAQKLLLDLIRDYINKPCYYSGGTILLRNLLSGIGMSYAVHTKQHY